MSDALARIRAINETAAFNRWAGFEVFAAGEGRAEIGLAMREDLTQYSKFLHAGVIAALIDTACGYAAATMAGMVLASNCQVSFYAPAVGKRFVARAAVVKAGKRQIFTEGRLYGVAGGQEKLVAGGSTILMIPT